MEWEINNRHHSSTKKQRAIESYSELKSLSSLIYPSALQKVRITKGKQTVQPIKQVTNRHTGTHTGSCGNYATVALDTLGEMRHRLSMEKAPHIPVRSCLPENRVSNSGRPLQNCQKILFSALWALHHLQTQNRWTPLLFKEGTRNKSQAKLEEVKKNFSIGEKKKKKSKNVSLLWAQPHCRATCGSPQSLDLNDTTSLLAC